MSLKGVKCARWGVLYGDLLQHSGSANKCDVGVRDATGNTGALKGWMDGAVQWQEGGASQGGWESGDPAPGSSDGSRVNPESTPTPREPDLVQVCGESYSWRRQAFNVI